MNCKALIGLLRKDGLSKEEMDDFITATVGQIPAEKWSEMLNLPTRCGWSFAPRVNNPPKGSDKERSFYVQATPTVARTRRLLAKVTCNDWMVRFNAPKRVASTVYKAAIGIRHGYELVVVEYVLKTMNRTWTFVKNKSPDFKSKTSISQWCVEHDLPSAVHLKPSQLRAVFQIHGKLSRDLNKG